MPMMTIHEMLDVSTERVRVAEATFARARHTLAAARSFGTPEHVAGAAAAVRDAAESYAGAMRTHANIVADFGAEEAAVRS